MKKIVILGSTGSIGVNALSVIKEFQEKFRVVGLSGFSNLSLLSKQIAEFKPEFVALPNLKDAAALKNKFKKTIFFSGTDNLVKLTETADYDILVAAVVGAVGLPPVISGLKRGKRIAIANKEPLVIAGKLLRNLAKTNRAEIIPVDSEHSAVFQCLKNENKQGVENILLTASGGPFFSKKIDFKKVTPEQALAHPNWSMGKKITIDSATMMNKGLEVIEARWLFDIPPENIKVIIHPQSVIHSMVEFKDGSTIAQMGTADMKLPIQYALAFPERLKNSFPKLNLIEREKLTFFKPDMNKFRCLKLAYQAIKTGGLAPAVLNAANEIAVNLFLNKKIGFNQIPDIVENKLNNFKNAANPSLEEIMNTDYKIRFELNNI
ncbi:MAG TPA: 1-deoxy-D-xylulose-5-phosphate reductoisomerase [bacterium]|nr:1-deoxy-D-xylulose-5-phosphate reductoisomerase [bacterium]HPN31649.1 1-deoxy-D-xylulose-5-phosphate reductoisomerase [bacterium]